MPQTKRLFLLDAMALIYRAYFALQRNPRINSKGLNTSAVVGFANSLYDILKNENPTHLGVAFDTQAPTDRAIEYTDYKANREAMPEDIALALPYIDRLIEAFNIPILKADGYEADDVIGTLAKRAEVEGFFTYMVTPDKDFGQLVSENIRIYKPPRGGNRAEIVGPKEVCERYNIQRPEQVIDILGLWGDASDNIPGIPGIGEKRAMELIGKYGSVENVIANAEDLKGKMKENVIEFADKGLISKALATIILNSPVEFDENALEIKEPDRDALKELFEELEFRTFAKRVFTDLSVKDAEKSGITPDEQKDLFDMQMDDVLDGAGGLPMMTIENSDHKYQLVQSDEERRNLKRLLGEQRSFCFDTETTGLDLTEAELVGIAFSFKQQEAYYLHLPETFDECKTVVEVFRSLFENEEIEKIAHNLKFDIGMMSRYGIEVKGKLFDTMLAHYLIEPDLRHNMDLLAETYLNYKPVSIETLIGKKGRTQLSMRTISPEVLSDYACEDADITYRLKQLFEPKLEEVNLRNLFDKIEIPLVPVLTSMEAEGVNLDIPALKEYSMVLEDEVISVRQKIYELAGTEFNIASPKQLGSILFDHLKIVDNPRRTKTGQYSTGEDVLIRLVNKHEIIRLILDYRSLTKLKSTYVDVLPNMISLKDKRIHTSYNQAVAATGRLSSNNPNLQNIPIRTERGREIRKAFVPRNENFTLLAADYSQVELRIIASISEDPGMLEAFNKGLDIHIATASRVYGVDHDMVSKEMRRNAKTVNFGIVYGISAFGLSERLNIPRGEASEIIKSYFDKYPGIKEYMDRTIAFAKENGYVETLMGRRRYLKDISSRNATVRGFAERNAINAPIQGSSADMIKIAMINIFEEFKKMDLQSKMILQVHDELIFDTHLEEVDLVKPIIEENMKTALPLKVPVVVEMSTGGNWLAAH